MADVTPLALRLGAVRSCLRELVQRSAAIGDRDTHTLATVGLEHLDRAGQGDAIIVRFPDGGAA